MANDFTVSDILGKGFKYELTITEAAPPPQEGTIAAILGTAHWGDINSPKFVSNGKSEFEGIFGDVNSIYDDGHAAMQYHLQKSKRGMFTRIADGTQTKAYNVVTAPDAPAVAKSNVIAPSLIALTPSTNALNLTIADTGGSPYSYVLSVVFTGSALATQASISKSGLGTINYSVGNTIVFNINGTVYTATVATASFSGTGANLATLLTTGSYGGATVTWGPSNPSPATVTFSGTATTFVATSVAYGATQTVTLVSDTGSVLVAATGANTDTGLNSNHTTIISQINAAIPGGMLVQFPGYVAAVLGTGSNLNKIVVTSPTNGSTVTITASGTANSLIGFPATSTGVAVKPIGTFRAIKTGRLGNTIEAIMTGTIATGNQLDLYFNGSLIGTFVNFNYVTTDPAYLGNLLVGDLFTKDIVEYNHGVDETDTPLGGVTSADEIPAGTYDLANGTSGDSTIDPTTDIVPYIDALSNVDIYDFDIVAAPGYSSQIVQDALQALCEKRQDCLTTFDTPLLSSVSNVKQWSNGLGGFGRTAALDSFYSMTYYPYIKCKKKVWDGATTNTKTLEDDFTPNIRVIGAIAQNDSILKSTFGAPAGIRTIMSDVTGLQMLLSEDDKTQLYADVYDGCINPIVFTTEDGFFIDGQKTGARKNPATNKVPKTSRGNVARTAIYLKKYVQKKVKFFFFNPSDKTSWDAFKKMVSGGMSILEQKRAIEPEAAADPRNSWSVKCDETTNTPQIIANNGMVCVAEFTPIETIERIKFIANLKERQLTVTVQPA